MIFGQNGVLGFPWTSCGVFVLCNFECQIQVLCSILTLSRENFIEFIYVFGEFCHGVHNEVDTNVKEEN